MQINKYLKLLIYVVIIFLSNFLFKVNVGNLYPISITSGIIYIIASRVDAEDSFIAAGFPMAVSSILANQGYYAIYMLFIYGLISLGIALLKKFNKLNFYYYLLVAGFELIAKVVIDIVLFESSILPQSFLYNGIQVVIAIVLIFIYNQIMKAKS